jgi:hypothetical protein
VPKDNTRPFRRDDARSRAVARWSGQEPPWAALAPPTVWRRVSAPLLPDIELLEQLTGESFANWRAEVGRGSFDARSAGADYPITSVTRSCAPSGRASS